MHILARIVESVLAQGISGIIIVIGYRSQDLKDHLSECYPDLEIDYIHNARYASTNNIVSLAGTYSGPYRSLIPE